MNYDNFYFLLSLIYIKYLMGFVSALTTEGILSGQRANISDFPYQAIILGTRDRDEVHNLLCSGVIVSVSWILSVAHCFMSTSKELKNVIFTAIVGTSALTIPDGSFVDIIYIYTDGYNADNYANDITMAKTRNDLVLSNTVREIGIANPRKLFIDTSGLVSGYGCHEIKIQNDFIKTDTDIKLRNTTVTVKPSTLCSRSFPFVKNSDKFCGVADYIDYEHTGVCEDDAGSPLVIDNEVVGLSSVCYFDCRDTNRGSLYIDVPKYFKFIHDVKLGNHQDSWLMHTVKLELAV